MTTLPGIQTVIAVAAIIAAVAYAVRAAYRTVKSAGDPCYGCDGCRIKEQIVKAKTLKRSGNRQKPACHTKNKGKNLAG